MGNLSKYRIRTVTVLLALTISSMMVCSVQFIVDGVSMDVQLSLDEGPDILVQRLQAGRQATVPLSWVENVSKAAGVRLATPRVWGYVDVGAGHLFTVMGVNVTEYQSVYGVAGTDIVSGGRFLNSSDRRRIVIGQGIVDMMAVSGARVQVGVGSRISLISYDGQLLEFEIVGVFDTQSKIFSYDLIITDLYSARELFGLDNQSCTDIAVWTELDRDLDSVAFRLDSMIPEARVLTRDAMRDLSLQVYGGRSGIILLLWSVLVTTVVLLVFTVWSAGSDEARREVGLLKALGFDTIDVLEVRMFEGLVLSLLGASTGISAAIVFDFVLGAPLVSGYILGWSLLLLNGGIPLAITPMSIFTVYAVSVVPILVAIVVPAWRNAITEPDIVLRGL